MNDRIAGRTSDLEPATIEAIAKTVPGRGSRAAERRLNNPFLPKLLSTAGLVTSGYLLATIIDMTIMKGTTEIIARHCGM